MDELYGDPEGEYTDVSKLPEEVISAANALLVAIKKTYIPHKCKENGKSKEVDLHEFVRSRWPEEAHNLPKGEK